MNDPVEIVTCTVFHSTSWCYYMLAPTPTESILYTCTITLGSICASEYEHGVLIAACVWTALHCRHSSSKRLIPGALFAFFDQFKLEIYGKKWLFLHVGTNAFTPYPVSCCLNILYYRFSDSLIISVRVRTYTLTCTRPQLPNLWQWIDWRYWLLGKINSIVIYFL